MTERPADFICDVCGTTVQPVLLPFGRRWITTGCPVCSIRERESEERRRTLDEIDARLAAVDSTLLSCGVGLRHTGARLDDFGPAYQKLHSGDRGLYVYGPRGTGKTHLMAAVMKALIVDHLTAAREAGLLPRAEYPRFISSTDLLREIRATFGNSGKESESGIIERYGICSVLVLDDLGAEQATEWTATTLYALMDRRYRDVRRTFVTSNLSLAELAAKVGDRITSRLAEMCTVYRLSGQDRRLQR